MTYTILVGLWLLSGIGVLVMGLAGDRRTQTVGYRLVVISAILLGVWTITTSP